MPFVAMDGYDDCVVGAVDDQWGRKFLVYDRQKVIARLMADGMSQEEAVEFHEYNQDGAWVGDNTPVFLDTDWRELVEASDESEAA